MNTPTEQTDFVPEVKEIARRVRMRLSGADPRHCAEIVEVFGGDGERVTLILHVDKQFSESHGNGDQILFGNGDMAYVTARTDRFWHIRTLDRDVILAPKQGEYIVFFRSRIKEA